MNSQNNSINESFTEKNYRSRKDENQKLKEEIKRLKEEVASLIKAGNENSPMKVESKPVSSKSLPPLKVSSNNNFMIMCQDLPKGTTYKIFNSDSNMSNESMQKNVESQANANLNSQKKCSLCAQIIEQINDLKNSLKQSIFKDMKQFYLNYYSEIEKATVKVNEVQQKFTKAENDFNNENIDKKVKTSQVKDILATSQKLLSLLTTFFSKYNKDIYFYTQNLKKVLEFAQKLVYSSNSVVLANSVNNLNLELGTNSNFFKNKSFIMTTILKFFYEYTKVISNSELRKIYPFYDNKTLSEVVSYFKVHCESLKQSIVESKWDYETEMSELDDSIVVKPSVKRLSEINMNNSYKIVNEKIMKLKKLEYDYCNMCEVMKHFAVVQELIVKGLYDFPNELEGSADSGKFDRLKSKHDYLEKALVIAEDFMLFKSNELDDDSQLFRKLMMRLLRNHKSILSMSSELL